MGFLHVLKKKSSLSGLVWLLCSAMVLVPAELLEPRYFFMPLAMYITGTNMEISSLRLALLRILNWVTVLILCYKPYKNVAFLW